MADTQNAAIRTTKPNGEATITVTLPDGTVAKAGGNRAKRAVVVIVTPAHNGRKAQLECRKDPRAAQAEMERHVVRGREFLACCMTDTMQQIAARALEAYQAAFIATVVDQDRHPQNGLDRCDCGCKYWDGGLCVDCGAGLVTA